MKKEKERERRERKRKRKLKENLSDVRETNNSHFKIVSI
jgi:hypothetical protein